MRTLPVQKIIKRVNRMLVGYYHYYGITDNAKNLARFKYVVTKLLLNGLIEEARNAVTDGTNSTYCLENIL